MVRGITALVLLGVIVGLSAVLWPSTRSTTPDPAGTRLGKLAQLCDVAGGRLPRCEELFTQVQGTDLYRSAYNQGDPNPGSGAWALVQRAREQFETWHRPLEWGLFRLREAARSSDSRRMRAAVGHLQGAREFFSDESNRLPLFRNPWRSGATHLRVTVRGTDWRAYRSSAQQLGRELQQITQLAAELADLYDIKR